MTKWSPAQLHAAEIQRIDVMLTDLRAQWLAAKPEDQIYAMARIDYWLDQRLALM